MNIGREIPWAHGKFNNRLTHTYTVSFQYACNACLWIVRATGGTSKLYTSNLIIEPNLIPEHDLIAFNMSAVVQNNMFPSSSVLSVG